ncbi:hypothetical protein FRACYDRAFT_197593 [Fragilariopsis cylindrus CCMP1102]|uniref:Prolyl 4-hydroxylase alpha subunit Fe(2+) 2OG dioxygenase domain-containing protein n=1 Tax=Fragilariopsis cylindrus CCMP1102 TaxID=635003 RepID=A0A1E7ENI6_9STRA|nr:hypothetical protein FRACYDRAFT_197593 [Fragilariopsis cylindrus CCMP1102]|eukprot:OEU07529.1 hypothetical protein FRACYDRAFT_197593 [Fragilariopsis cylindrus CCMP1102]
MSRPIIQESNIILSRSYDTIKKEISKNVLRHKLQKLRHLVLPGVISTKYLDNEIFYPMHQQQLFQPQTVTYNGGIANVKKWKISSYLEVMEGGVPCTNPNLKLLEIFRPLLETCDDLFLVWYKQQHACNSNSNNKQQQQNQNRRRTCQRLMTFVTRYTPVPGEQALLKHIDGAGKVDGSCVIALPVDKWSAPYDVNSFEGHGGGLTFWDGKEPKNNKAPQKFRPREIHYETRSGDIAFIDRAVWHQADPITKGTRWALVIFYKVMYEDDDNDNDE